MLDIFIKKDRPQLAKQLRASLDSQGKKALETAVVKRAFDKSIKDGRFNALAFNKEIKKLGTTSKVILSKKSKDMMDGLNKVASAIQEIGPQNHSRCEFV